MNPETEDASHDREARRQAALARFAIMDTQSETSYDDIAKLAVAICGTPIALVSLIDDERQWFKAKVGTDLDSIPRSISFCDHAIRNPGQVMQVTDALQDPRFVNNPLVTDGPHVRFYAGAPIVSTDGEAVGAVCVVDATPRALTAAQIESLAALSRQAALLLEIRHFLGDIHVVLANRRREADVLPELGHRLHEDRQALRHQFERLQQAAMTDKLTGLLNRAGMDELRNDQVFMHQIEAAPYAVMMIDVDNFKPVNDSMGHAEGDAVLRRVAEAVREGTRGSDRAGRLGGDEFLVILPRTPADGALGVAKRLRAKIEEEFKSIGVTLSIGIIESDKGYAERQETLKRADDALYEAKRRGRNQIFVEPPVEFVGTPPRS